MKLTLSIIQKNLNKNKSPDQKKVPAGPVDKKDFDRYESEFQVLDETDINEDPVEESEESLDIPSKSYVPPAKK